MSGVHFLSSSALVNFPVTVITGACRSGKSLLGNAMAALPRIEYAEEPWAAMMLPVAARMGKLDREFALGFLAALVTELFNDLVLLRSANFRPGDQSAIWSKKTAIEIFGRLTNVCTRSDVVELVSREQLQLVMTLAETGPCLDFIASAIPRAKLLHVVRNGFDVARNVAEKGWLSDDQLRRPLNAQVYRRIHHPRDCFLPWWVQDGDEEYFLELTDYERGLYYWCEQLRQTLDVIQQSRLDVCTVRFEDLVRRPHRTVEDVIRKLDLHCGAVPAMAIPRIHRDRVAARTPSAANEELQNRVVATTRRLEMDESS